MSSYFTYASKKSYEHYTTLSYLPIFNPSQSRIYKSYSIINKDEKLEPSAEPTELFYYETKYPSFVPRFNSNYTCICKTEQNDNEKQQIIILIVMTSATSFFCILLFLLIIWYRFYFKKKLLNKRFAEEFGVELCDLSI